MAIITEAFKNEYRDNFLHLVQQEKSKLEGAVIVDTEINAEQKFYDQIGTLEFTELVGRHPETVNVDPSHTRRRLVTTPYTLAPLIDRPDRLRAIADPTSGYSKSVMMAAQRRKDQTIIDALGGTAYTGKNGTDTVDLTVGTNTVPVDYVRSGTSADSNFTLDKWRRAKEILDGFNVPDSGRHIAVSPGTLEYLLTLDQINSIDFNQIRALVDGNITKYLGFEVHMSTLLPIDSNNVRSLYAWHEDGVVLGYLENPTTRVDELPTKNYAVQVYGSIDLGATRLQEEMVVEILCDEDL